MTIRLKRAYEPPDLVDGYRVLVDRLWPRGRSRTALRLDAWLPELAPSRELRTWFGHDPARWEEFRRRYEDELARDDHRAPLGQLAATARERDVTLVYGARDTAHNQAVVLRELLERRLG